MIDWNPYYKKHSIREPRKLFVKAVSFCSNKENALDLGAGTLIESKFLVDAGFKNIIAVDNSPEVKDFAQDIDTFKLTLVMSSFNDFFFPKNKFDLVNAQFALPFYGKEDFPIFIKKIIDSLAPKGIFVGQFFGVNDSWNVPDSEIIFHTKEEGLQLLAELEIIEFLEEEKENPTASGAIKHWHLFHFIVKR